MKDYVKEFVDKWEDNSITDGQLFVIAKDYIEELQLKANQYKKMYEVKSAQYEEAKEIIARQAKLIAEGV